MAPYRLAIVTPRFWPLIDDRTTHLLRLAESLAAAGREMTVVTPRWTRAWPEHMTLGPISLVRLAGDGLGSFGTLRWLYALNRWLRERPRCDAVLVSGLKHESYVVVRAGRVNQLPTMLLAHDECPSWQQSALLGARIAAECRQASKIIAPSVPAAEALLAAHYKSDQISIVPRNEEFSPGLTAENRAAARAALAAVNYDLATTSTAFVAVAIGRLDEHHRFGDLIRAWRVVTARHSDARLWLVGDGPERQRLYQQIGDLDQRFRAFLPGTFDCLTDLLAAANVLLVPGHHQTPPLAMLDAAAMGLPCLAADSPAARHCQSTCSQVQIYALGDGKSLAAQVLAMLEKTAGKQSPSTPHYSQPKDRISPATEAARFLTIIDQLRTQLTTGN